MSFDEVNGGARGGLPRDSAVFFVLLMPYCKNLIFLGTLRCWIFCGVILVDSSLGCRFIVSGWRGGGVDRVGWWREGKEGRKEREGKKKEKKKKVYIY